MASFIDTLYPVPDYRRTSLSLLRWWESRRLVYNKAVGSAGLVTLAGVFVLHPNRADFFMPETAVVVLAYALVANVCFSLGWVAELVAKRLWGRRAPDMGPLLFREGLIFSVGLTLFPLLVAVIFTVVRVLLKLVT
ncbi:MAG: hypothetical protein ACREL7_05140 [Longimicrobiales bacterium]